MFKLFLDSNDRQIKKLAGLIEKINSFEDTVSKFSETQIKEKTEEWKNKAKDLNEDEQKACLDEILPEAFAVVREASKRALDKRHYDVQLLAGIALHQSKVAEQKTGEGKTLTATLALYLNSLTGKGVHLVTPNDYL